MRTVLARAAALAAALLVLLPMAASAEIDDYAAEATTSAVRLEVLPDALPEGVGSPLLELISTDAFASSDPTASASVEAITVLGTELIPVRQADSTGEPVRDPAEGQGCAETADPTGLELSLVCAFAEADAGGPGEVEATADTELLGVSVSGSLLSSLLTDQLGTVLTDLPGAIADGAVAAAVDELRAGCDEILGNDALDPLDEVPNTVDALLDELPEEAGPLRDAFVAAVDALAADNPCSAILTITISGVTDPALDLGPVATALEGQNLVTLSVDGASSEIVGSDASVVSAAEQAFVELSGPSLGFLDDVLNGIVAGMYGGVVEQIELLIGEDQLPDEFDLSEEIAAALDMIPLFGIDEPLLTAEVDGGRATATLTRADATTSAGGRPPAVTLSIAGGVMELFGQSPDSGTITLEAGQSSGPIAEGTPLESSITVGALTTDEDATFGDEELPGSTASASATSVNLLQGEGAMGGITLELVASSAGVYGTAPAVAAPDPDPDPDPMPHTGGGAAAAAVLALGAAVALRRRRD